MPRRLPYQTYLDGILAGDRLILSRAITLAESQRPEDRELSEQLLLDCLPKAVDSFRLGITGVPGVGKSTFIDAFGSLLIEQGHKVAVLAIDPSSTRSKGAILGDKTRMDRLAHAPEAYIRPSATAGTLGGIAQRTKEAMLLCEAAGYQWVLVETVGVGQSETSVRELVDLFMLLMLPNAGDDLQGIKKGIMEMADLLVINKADGAAREMARASRQAYSQALRLFPVPDSGRRPAALTCSAAEGEGLEAILEELMAYQAATRKTGFWQQRRSDQEVAWFDRAVEERIRAIVLGTRDRQQAYRQLRQAVAKGERLPLEAARALLSDLG